MLPPGFCNAALPRDERVWNCPLHLDDISVRALDGRVLLSARIRATVDSYEQATLVQQRLRQGLRLYEDDSFEQQELMALRATVQELKKENELQRSELTGLRRRLEGYQSFERSLLGRP